ncbi:MAG: hypothetical protein EOP93_20740, partial [Lysobacteraceae bacterium]
MKAQYSLLSLAIASGLAIAALPSDAANLKSSAAVARAQGLINASGAAIHRAGGDAFVARGAIVDANGAEHVRYERSYNGLPVIGGDFVVHSRNGKLDGVSQT